MQKPIIVLAAMVMLGAGALAPAQAQSTGGATGSTGGAAGAGSDNETGGTTGALTTTPRAKSDDAAGTRGAASPTVATPGGAETATGGADHGCTEAQRYDAATNTCVPK
jgi:hypothetical protein